MQEDNVEYHIYSTITPWNVEQDIIKFEQTVAPLIEGYMWQHDPFKLKLWSPSSKQTSQTIPLHIWGCTRFGDNIEDEWVIVHILLELTKQFKDIVISVTDNDGQFLLIEAAHKLPKWLQPDNSSNRVWLKQGAVHIIPFPNTPAQVGVIPVSVDIPTALRLMNTTIATEASASTQEPIITRATRAYEESRINQHHNVALSLPVPVATLLRTMPSLIAPAVNAFYYRDSDDLKLCTTMTQFPPSPSIMTRVRFTRCLYAQLAHQKFEPPSPPFPQLPKPTHPTYKAHELGSKLACGFEILYNNSKVAKPYDTRSQRNAQLKFLRSMGHFTEEDTPVDTQQQDIDFEDNTYLFETMNNLLTSTPPLSKDDTITNSADDSDDWLAVEPHALDKLLQAHAGDSRNDAAVAAQLDTISSDVQRFVNHVSDFEGAEFPGEGGISGTGKLESVNLNFDTFFKVMKSALGEEYMDENGDEDEDGDSDLEDDLFEGGPGGTLDEGVLRAMEATDSELSTTAVKSDLNEDLDINLVQNLLASFGEQNGLSGPASSLLAELLEFKK